MPAGNIVVQMQLNNGQFVQAMNVSVQHTNAMTRSIQRLGHQHAATTRQVSQSTAAFRRNNEIMRNGIYLVEDAASVYGTQGLAGAVRAASNNLTMMAMTMGGPWMAAITVATVAITQLWLAFKKGKDVNKEVGPSIDSLIERGKEAANRMRKD